MPLTATVSPTSDAIACATVMLSAGSVFLTVISIFLVAVFCPWVAVIVIVALPKSFNDR